MKIAIIGSRNLNVDISKCISKEVTKIISGVAIGIDSLAEAYADENNIPKHIIRPEYNKYGKAAPLKRNEIILDVSDMIVATWDQKSRGTKYAINYAKKLENPLKFILFLKINSNI